MPLISPATELPAADSAEIRNFPTKKRPPALWATPQGPSEFEVRVQMLDSTMKPYVWEILNTYSGEVAHQSVERFRKPSQAWAAGNGELLRGSFETTGCA